MTVPQIHPILSRTFGTRVPSTRDDVANPTERKIRSR